jgi:ABC-type Zn uptake system ZnuABC Zn-binding protein ZnuA
MSKRWSLAAAALLAAVLSTGPVSAAGTLRVVATVPDLGSLAGSVGGEDVEVTTLVKGPQDPHFMEPRPSFIRALHEADLFVMVGMELEVGWVPPLLATARNPAIQPGGAGYLDASRAIVPLEVPQGAVTRAMGDVHPYGNPHYLCDPLNGLRVAALLRDRLAELRPERAAAFAERYRRFAGELATRLVGAAAAGLEPEALARAVEDRRLEALLGGPPTDGWLGALHAAGPRKAVEDHKLWEYFARRFGLAPIATLEPLPGIAPTTRHLAEVVDAMRRDGVSLILASVYYDPRHARWVAERTGARIVPLAHQVGAREGAVDYLSTVDYNVRVLREALRAGG